MRKIKMLSLFSGIGAFEKALKNIGIDYELCGFSEIDKYAIKSYCAIHNENIEKSLGDITKLDISTLPNDIDLLTHGSPCQSFSLAGKQDGGDEGSGTRSSLLWYSVKIIKEKKPKIVIWENVANVLSEKHRHNFDKYLSTLEEVGYINKYEVLNAKDYGVAQTRKRLLCISIRKDCLSEDWINKKFEFSDVNKREPKKIRDFLEPNYESNMILQKKVRPYEMPRKRACICVGQSSNEGSQAGKVYSVDGIFPTICAGTHGYALGYIMDNGVARRLTPVEVFRLMGFTKEDCDKCKELKMSNTQLYKQGGNSIVVSMLEEVFKILFIQ